MCERVRQRQLVGAGAECKEFYALLIVRFVATLLCNRCCCCCFCLQKICVCCVLVLIAAQMAALAHWLAIGQCCFSYIWLLLLFLLASYPLACDANATIADDDTEFSSTIRFYSYCLSAVVVLVVAIVICSRIFGTFVAVCCYSIVAVTIIVVVVVWQRCFVHVIQAAAVSLTTSCMQFDNTF